MMITPAMDLTGVTVESSRSAETSPHSSAPPEVNKPNSQSPRPSALPPYFRSYEAYIEHCVAKVGREEIAETAFDRLCASCTAAFKKIHESPVDDMGLIKAPFCSVSEFIRSAAEGNCHVCHWLMADILRRRESTPTSFDAQSLESGVDWLERGDAALTLEKWFRSLCINIMKDDGTQGNLTWVEIEDENEDYSRGKLLLLTL